MMPVPLFPFELTPTQQAVFKAMQDFVLDKSLKVFILKGYAGTGKTTLAGGLRSWILEQKIDFVLLASTGRAAKVLSDKSGCEAETLHKHIYIFNNLNEDLEKLSILQENFAVDDKGQLSLIFELRDTPPEEETIYIIDESSMISDTADQGLSYARFGNGELLNDLFRYDPKGKFIFVGDPCQLPPINQPLSPALSVEYIAQKYQMPVIEHTLTDILRQQEENDIIGASFRLRLLWQENPAAKWARFPLSDYRHIKLHDSHEQLLNAFLEAFGEHGNNHAVMICQTNRQCTDLNMKIRQKLGIGEFTPVEGDLLLVTQNNYLTGLVNGDIVEVLKIGRVEYRAGLTFKPVRVKELASERINTVLLIEDIVLMQGTNLNPKQHKDLFIDFYLRMREQGIYQKDQEFRDKMFRDPYLNALRAVYGYAVTCHKAQGGEWNEVFLHLDNKIQGIPRPGIYQWMYTAVTRARQNLHIVNDWFIG